MTRPFPLAPLAVLTLVWFGIIVWLAAQGAFTTNGAAPITLFPAVATPTLVAALAWFALPGLRARLAETSIVFLIGLQSLRVMGITFLFVWGLGLLPTLFAFVAAVGDLAVGILALHATIRIAEGNPDGRRLARRVTWAGLADFTIVLGIAVLSSKHLPLAFSGQPLPVAMQDLPMVLIPAFLVPLFVIFHLAAIAKLRTRD